MVKKGINSILNQTKTIEEEVVNGNLDFRANKQGISIDFKSIIDSMNNIIDAFVRPINVTAEYVERISAGDIPQIITDDYNGDFKEIKNNLNNCISSINGLVDESMNISNAAVEGFLNQRADQTNFQGDYKKIITGMNDTIDALVGHMDSIETPIMILGVGGVLMLLLSSLAVL